MFIAAVFWALGNKALRPAFRMLVMISRMLFEAAECASLISRSAFGDNVYG